MVERVITRINRKEHAEKSFYKGATQRKDLEASRRKYKEQKQVLEGSWTLGKHENG